MRTKKQVMVILVFALLAFLLRRTVGFSATVDDIVLGSFVLLGCWFSYSNHKKSGEI